VGGPNVLDLATWVTVGPFYRGIYVISGFSGPSTTLTGSVTCPDGTTSTSTVPLIAWLAGSVLSLPQLMVSADGAQITGGLAQGSAAYDWDLQTQADP
jgi:hypothetical protein